jgi:two-component system sensor histidine kinase AtoS
MRPQLEQCGIRVDSRTEPARVSADPAQLRGVLLNLLMNVVDALPGGGRVEVSMENDLSADPPVVRVRVADDGAGVPAQNRDRIFQPFFTTKPTGTGIGLPLSVRVVETHGGHLRLEGGTARGATFVIEVPLAPNPPARDRAARRWRRTDASEQLLVRR